MCEKLRKRVGSNLPPDLHYYNWDNTFKEPYKIENASYSHKGFVDKYSIKDTSHKPVRDESYTYNKLTTYLEKMIQINGHATQLTFGEMSCLAFTNLVWLGKVCPKGIHYLYYSRKGFFQSKSCVAFTLGYSGYGKFGIRKNRRWNNSKGYTNYYTFTIYGKKFTP